VQKKASDALKTADKIANSPEVGAIGTLSGPQAKEVINKGKEIISDANKSPLIVGKSRVASMGQQPSEHSYIQQTVDQGSKNFDKGPPVVTMIQAIDQYGNIIAQAQNPHA